MSNINLDVVWDEGHVGADHGADVLADCVRPRCLR